MNDLSVTGHAAHEMMKLPLYRFEVVENISVVEFQIADNQCFWQVVNKL